MPFFALPNNVGDIIMRKRVVINEQNVNEFVLNEYELVENNRNTLYLNANNKYSTSKKKNKLSELLSGSSRSSKNYSAQSGNYSLPNQFQPPILANNSITNPFYDNRFPVNKKNQNLSSLPIIFY